jgi:hypothetical protein
MSPRATATFDADTSAYSAKMERAKKQTGDVLGAFTQGPAAIARVTGAVTGLVAVSSTLFQTWQGILQTQEEAAARIRGASGARAKALSLGRDENDRNRIGGAIDATRRETGMDEGGAAGFQFQLESLGLADQRAPIARLANLGANVEQTAMGVARIRKVFGDEAENVQDLVNKLFQGAASSEVGIDEFASSVAKVGSVVKSTGTPLDELIATLSQLGGKDINEIATGLKALATAGIKSGAKGGILAYVEQLQGMHLSDAQMSKKLGSVEAFEGYKLIAGQLGNIKGARSKLGEAVSGDIVGQRLDLVGGDVKVAAAQATDRAKAEAEQAQEEAYGPRELARQRRNAAIDQGLAQTGEFSTFMGQPLTYLGYKSGLRRLIESFTKSDASDFDKETDQVLKELKAINRNSAPKPPTYRPENTAHPELPR